MYLYKRPKSPFWWTEFTVEGDRVRRSTETASRRDAEGTARRLRDEAIAAAKAKPKGRPVEVLTLDQACGRYWIEHGAQVGRDEQLMAKEIKDDDGHAVTDGCVIQFAYGIPPVGVDAKVVNRNGKLVALTPNHNPTECAVSYIAKHFNFWIIKER